MSDEEFDPEDVADPFEMQLEARAAEARSRARLPSRATCLDCEEEIPTRRRELLPGVTHCVDCQSLLDRSGVRHAYARQASD